MYTVVRVNSLYTVREGEKQRKALFQSQHVNTKRKTYAPESFRPTCNIFTK